MAYTRRSAAPRKRRSVNARPARRAVRRTSARRTSAGKRSGPQVVKIVIEHSQTAGAGMGGMDLPQITTQTKKGRF